MVVASMSSRDRLLKVATEVLAERGVGAAMR
jgi:hypothetical protein